MTKAKTVQVSLDLPQSVFSALRQDPASFVGEMRLAAAVKWYEMHRISQAKAAEVAGLSRSEFLTALARFDVSPFQYDADEIVAEVVGG
jgi:predicted HTH domain antitoxin